MAHQPLSSRSVAWLERFGTPNADFVRVVLGGRQFAAHDDEMTPLKEHAWQLAQAYNEVINVIMNHEAEPEGEHRSYRQLAQQLRRGKEMVRARLITEAQSWEAPITLSDAQQSALMHVYDAWCTRVGHNIGAGGRQR